MQPEARRRARRSLGALPLLLLTAAEVERASDVAERRLSWVVYGLLALAVLIAVATVLFWRATRPDPAPDPDIAMRWVNPADAAQRAPQAPERRAGPSTAAPSQVPPQTPSTAARRPPNDRAVAALAPQRGGATRPPPQAASRLARPDPEGRGTR